MSESDLTKRYHKPTVLQVVPTLVSGGVERGVVEIAKHLKKSGYNSIVISAGGTLVKELEENDVLHIYMNSASKNPFIIWYNSKLIKDIIKKYNVDILHARSRAPAWSCYIAAKSTKVKFITTFHGIYNISNCFKKYYNKVMTKGEKVVAVSNFVKKHLLDNYKVDEKKIIVIGRGVDYNYFNPENVTEEQLIKCREKYDAPSNIPIILLPSRMTSWKGQNILVEALAKLKHHDFYCLMVGDLSKHPNFTNRVKNLLSSLKLQNKAQIFGNDSDILPLYGIADIVISASIEPEAFGRTIIEAQAMKKLVIATNIGGAVETVTDNKTGFHVIPKDAEGLAQKIDHCLSILGTEQAKDIQQAAREAVIKHFSLEIMLDKNAKLYNSLL